MESSGQQHGIAAEWAELKTSKGSRILDHLLQSSGTSNDTKCQIPKCWGLAGWQPA